MALNTKLYGKNGETQTQLNPETVAAQVIINDADGSGSNVEVEIEKLRTDVAALLNGGVVFKGALTTASGLPTVSYKAGWQYIVQDAGTYAGKVCETGDFIVCVKNYASGSASNSDWAVLQVNIVGAVTGPANSVANHVAAFDGTSGKIIKDSGYTIGKSVPADAEFTDTTYAPATSAADGLMTAAQFTKLEGIEAGADKTDRDKVAAAGAFIKATDTADSITEGNTKKLMTAAERTKLAGITAGAEVNQNAISKVTVGSTTITATGKTDTLKLEAGTGISLAAATADKKVTISEAYVDSCIVSNLDDVPANLRDGGLIILKQ
jgi:hypothetical protein|nr:MAG TPA: hypothetical protein [Caudoviricetes sp.]